MLKYVLSRSPSKFNSESFINRELDIASSNAEKNRSIPMKVDKPLMEQIQVIGASLNQSPSVCPTTSKRPKFPLVQEEVHLNVITSSSQDDVSKRSQEKYPELGEDSEQDPEYRWLHYARGTSLCPIQCLLETWSDILNGNVFPKQEETKQSVHYETHLHNGNCLVLL